MARFLGLATLAFVIAFFGWPACGSVHGQEVFTAGKSNEMRWSQTAANKRLGWRQLAVTSTDKKSELNVEFYSELGGLGMTVSFLDRPPRPCRKAVLDSIGNTSLLLDGKPLPGKPADSFSAGCRDGKWVERAVLGNVDGNVAIAQALLAAKGGTMHLSSADGSFDHSYAVSGFRELEHGDLAVVSAFKRLSVEQISGALASPEI